MRIKKGTPGKGGEQRAEQFSNLKVPVSTKTTDAWCAGEPYWCVAHRHTDAEPGTKICLTWATDGAVKCPRCRPKSRTEWVAYVPLYRDLDNKAVFVICHETVKDMLDLLHFGMMVFVGRVEKDASIFVKRSVSEKRYTSTMPTRQQPCDLTETLLNIWKLPQYEAWLTEQEQEAEDQKRAKRPTIEKGLKADGSRYSPMYNFANPPDDKPADETSGGGGDVDDALKGIMGRRNAASSNGHHKPR